MREQQVAPACHDRHLLAQHGRRVEHRGVPDLVPDPVRRRLVAGLATTVGLFSYVQALPTLGAASARFQQQQEEQARQGVRAALDDLEDSTEPPALIRLNRRQMEELSRSYKGRASSAYVASQIAIGRAADARPGALVGRPSQFGASSRPVGAGRRT